MLSTCIRHVRSLKPSRLPTKQGKSPRFRSWSSNYARNTSRTVYASACLTNKRAWKDAAPIICAAVIAGATLDDKKDKPRFDLLKWLRQEAVPSTTDVNQLIKELMAKCKMMSDSELTANFEALADVLFGLVTEKLRQGDLESPFQLLDTFWELNERLDGLYRSSRLSVTALGLESDLHQLKNDMPALKKTNMALWKLLKTYELLGEDYGLFRSRIAFGLAVQFSVEGDCASAAAFMSDSTNYTNRLLWNKGSEGFSERHIQEMLGGLRTSLRSYYELRHYAYQTYLSHDGQVVGTRSEIRQKAKSKACCDVFESSAHRIYHSLVLLAPETMPAWKDIKRIEKILFEKEQKQREQNGER